MSATPRSRRLSWSGIAGGVAATSAGGVTLLGLVGFVVEARDDPRVAIGLAFAAGMVIVFGLLALAVTGLGIAATIDATRGRTGAAAGRLWLLFGLGIVGGLAGLVEEPNPGTMGFVAIMLMLAAPNFVAWQQRAR